ncbi:MAG: rRNA (uracil1498-N3)-methyltransferase, partial [Pseudomonadota bacterium]|nr:rRNA (uracil1498-N3)-methyltransferase [Pseudomonadota bacterium]
MMIPPRFFCPEPLSVGASVMLPEGAARHAARVLRLGAVAEVSLFDGKGGVYEARIASVRMDAVEADVVAWKDV